MQSIRHVPVNATLYLFRGDTQSHHTKRQGRLYREEVSCNSFSKRRHGTLEHTLPRHKKRHDETRDVSYDSFICVT